MQKGIREDREEFKSATQSKQINPTSELMQERKVKLISWD